jgi:ABC-type branched-subunit amino acid transport system substrate-binding protein
MRTRRPLVVAIVAALALLSGGCGARLSDDQVAAVESGSGTGGGTGSGTGTGTRTGTGTGTGTGSGTGTGTGTGTGGTATGGGTGGQPTGGDTGGQPTGDGAAACAPEPSDEVGVSDDTIRIGNVSTISGPIAGFGQTGVNAIAAYFNYVNSQGGVCGRQLELVRADDRLDAGTNRSETQRLSDEVLAFAGEVTVVDDGGADVLNGTNIPRVSLSIGSAAARLPNNFSPNPLNPDNPGNGTLPVMQYFAAQGISSAAIIWPAQADARARGQGFQHDLQQAGIGTIDTYEVAITETNYVRVAQEIENAGSQLVITTLEVSGMARLAQAFQQVGYLPEVPYYGSQAYGRQFLELAGDAANGTKIAVTFSIFEDAGTVPPMATFLEWYERTAPGSNPDFFSINSWAAADMLVRALREAGGAPTRDAVVAALQAMTEYTGDGFMAPRNPAGKTMGNCFAVVGVENGAWTRIDPAAGFVNC